MRHVTHLKEPCHSYACVMCIHMNESRLKDGERNHERGLPMQHAICADIPLRRTSPCQACTFTPCTQELDYSRSVASSSECELCSHKNGVVCVRKDVCTPCLNMSHRTQRLQAQSPRVRSLGDTRLVQDGDMAGRRNPVSTVFSAGTL